ncbi:hypothetical protein, partial [Streptococcus pneumoniae]|uniref:hypothetical protein n=1 Tax=Streptococcus pneumoniae TaxID=1313 RepID=UPI001E52607C
SYALQLSSDDGVSIGVDLIARHVDMPTPGIEASSSNLTYSRDGFNVRAALPGFPVERCMEHVRRTQFWFFYEPCRLWRFA